MQRLMLDFLRVLILIPDVSQLVIESICKTRRCNSEVAVPRTYIHKCYEQNWYKGQPGVQRPLETHLTYYRQCGTLSVIKVYCIIFI